MLQIRQLDNGHFYSGLYLKAGKPINSFLEEIVFENRYMVLQGEDVDCCPYDDAHDLLQGSCNLFALALHNQFNYEIHEIRSKSFPSFFHYYAKAFYRGIPIFIDVRGATTDYHAFCAGLLGLTDSDCCTTHLDITKEPIDEEWSATGLKFSHAIINAHPEYYNLSDNS